MKSGGTQSQWIHLQNTPLQRLREHCRSVGGKIIRAKLIRVFAVRLYLLGPEGLTNMTDLNKEDINKHALVDGGRSVTSRPYTKN